MAQPGNRAARDDILLRDVFLPRLQRLSPTVHERLWLLATLWFSLLATCALITIVAAVFGWKASIFGLIWIVPIAAGAGYFSAEAYVSVGRYRMSRRWSLYERQLPAEVSLSRSQNGEIIALITMANGDLRTLALPAEINGPEAAFRYLLSELMPPEVQAGIGSIPWS